MNYQDWYAPAHCPGCRCSTTTTTTLQFITPYRPRHRKPGPAQ